LIGLEPVWWIHFGRNLQITKTRSQSYDFWSQFQDFWIYKYNARVVVGSRKSFYIGEQ
jgi:hypothetical protein